MFVLSNTNGRERGDTARGRGIEAGAQSSGGDMSSVKPDLKRELTELHTKCVTRPLRPRACDRVHAVARACPACAGRGARLVAAVLPVRMCMVIPKDLVVANPDPFDLLRFMVVAAQYEVLPRACIGA